MLVQLLGVNCLHTELIITNLQTIANDFNIYIGIIFIKQGKDKT